jgi:flagellar motor switch protein FliN
MSLDDVKLDELSLDDDALFADLDNEVRLEGAGDDSLSLGDKDDLNLDFDVEALPGGAKSGNGKHAPTADDLDLNLDDATLGGGDLDLNLDDMGTGGSDLNLGGVGAGGDLNLDLGEGSVGGAGDDLDLGGSSASAPGDALDLDISDAGMGEELNLDMDMPAGSASGGDSMELDISDAGDEDLKLELESPGTGQSGMGGNLDLGERQPGEDLLDIGDVPSAASGGGDDLDLSLDMDDPLPGTAGGSRGDFDLNLDMNEPTSAFGGQGEEMVELELDGTSGTIAAAAETEPTPTPDMELEDLSQPMGAEELDTVTLSDEPGQGGAGAETLDLGALPTADEFAAPSEDFQAVPDLDLDSIDLNLDQTASEFKAVPDVDLDAVDLNLDMPMAEVKGDTGAPVAPPEAMTATAPGPAGPRIFPGMGTGVDHKLEVARDELLELNLNDLEAKQGAPFVSQASPSAAPSMHGPAMHAPAMSAGAPVAMQSVPTQAGVGSVLLSIPHQVQVRMGSVSLLGQEILNLSHGSVVPLNRTVGEPVDLTLEGRTIAQGEIVVINGRNLGVRIVALSK